MASVQYNGVNLPYCYVSQFAQRVVYDDVGDVDRYCIEFDIQVQCVIHYYYLSLLIPAWNQVVPTNTDPVSIMYYVRQLLLVPRKQLSVQVNGFELIPNYQNKGAVDAQNGPKPKYCDIIEMSSTSFLVSFAITAKYIENIPTTTTKNFSTSNQPGSPVLYNRWGESVKIDDTNFATKSRTGKFVIRTDNPQGFIADQLRSQFAVVSLAPGFLRQSSDYIQDPNGMGLGYTIVDKEVFKKPIQGSFKSSGYYRETTTKQGAFRMAEAHLALEGDKSTSQASLITLAINTCISKIGARGKQVVNNQNATIRFVESGAVTMDLFENKVEVTIRAWLGTSIQRTGGLAAFVGMNDSTPNSFADYVPNYSSYGSSNYLMQAAAYYDPTLANSSLIASPPIVPSQNTVAPVSLPMQNRGTQIGQAGKLGG